MRLLSVSIASLTTCFFLINCAAGGGAAGDGDGDNGVTGDGDGDANTGDGDAAPGDGDVTPGDGDTVPGDGDAVSGDGDGTGGLSATGGTDGGTGGVTASGGTSGVSCTPGTGVEDVGAASFLDKATCLVWQKADTHAGTINNRGALVHCSSLDQDGQTWRLPTAQELRTYPNLPDAGNAYLSGPTYIPTTASDDATGCTDNSHSCNLTQYSAGNFGCGWQGPGAGGYPVLCVSGTANPGTLDAAFEVATCCSGSSTYKEVDCSPY